MAQQVTVGATAPFPPAGANGGDGFPARLRRFGTVLEDLEIDLAEQRPVAITELLARCTVPEVDRELIWDLPVGKRIGRLLALASLSGVEEFDADIDCPKCGLSTEVTLTVEELLAASSATDTAFVDVRVEGQGARYRLPTGRDQLGWTRFADDDEAALTGRMLADLRLEGTAPIEAVEEALDSADPLVRAAVRTACPRCGHAVEREMDVAGGALGKLQSEQNELLRGVHLLASRYHWSEAEIFALPPWRRERYLELLRQEAT